MPPVVGYNAHNRQVHAGNIHGQDWQICRSLAKERITKNNNKSERRKKGETVSETTEIEVKPYNTFHPISGYRGFVKRVAADNIMGCGYQQSLAKAKESDVK